MAIFNEILSARFSRALTKLFSMKGGVPVRQLAGEITATIPMFFGVENRFLELWSLFVTTADRGPTAAQTNAVRLRNPSGSNMIAVIEKLSIWSATSQALIVSIGAIAADLTAQGTASVDARNPSLSTLLASFSDASPPALPSRYISAGLLAFTVYDLIACEDQEIPILPGGGIQIQNSTVNTELVVMVRWRERGLEESERQ